MVIIPKYRVILWNLPVYYDKLKIHEKRLVREQYIKEQDSKCYFCKANLYKQPKRKVFKMKLDKRQFPTHFFKHKIHLHHCHNTGLTLGAVHAYCNAVLWKYYGE